MNSFGKLVFIGVIALGVQTWGQEGVNYETVRLEGHTFSVPDAKLPWVQALNACNDRGQRLATVEDAEKDDILVRLFVEQEGTNVTMKGNSWIAAREDREGVWIWRPTGTADTKPTYYQRWFMDGQPDDKENLNCVYIAASAYLYWRDANCSSQQYYLCEGEPTESTTTSPGLTGSTGPGSGSTPSTTEASGHHQSAMSFLILPLAIFVLFCQIH